MRIFSTRPDRETNSGRPPKRVLRKAYGAAKLDLYSRSHGVPHRQGARVNVSHDADAVRDVGAPPREDCSPLEAVAQNPRCLEIAVRFDKMPEQVAKDINREFLASYGRW